MEASDCNSCKQAPDCGILRMVEALESISKPRWYCDTGADEIAQEALNARSQCCEGYLKTEE